MAGGEIDGDCPEKERTSHEQQDCSIVQVATAAQVVRKIETSARGKRAEKVEIECK
eukprot:CAMPEP_0196666686 /NCGR_PEP_ID=MMETSP1086-20130531/64654_1 /TAXON_ID=77921 /ORGANISM="Cyanoptyche  gloeocystis , Strain SAG4.97" /LENGTH=55 /DNA_ID=CAMNT_0042003911 /DNA_START=201 /DNA_END=368 /DNA_ORIENTATION=-